MSRLLRSSSRAISAIARSYSSSRSSMLPACSSRSLMQRLAQPGKISRSTGISLRKRSGLCDNTMPNSDSSPRSPVSCPPLLDETLPCPMQAECRLLVFVLQRYEAHARTCHCLADRRSVVRIVLATLARHTVRRYGATSFSGPSTSPCDCAARTNVPSDVHRSRLPCRQDTAAIARSLPLADLITRNLGPDQERFARFSCRERICLARSIPTVTIGMDFPSCWC